MLTVNKPNVREIINYKYNIIRYNEARNYLNNYQLSIGIKFRILDFSSINDELPPVKSKLIRNRESQLFSFIDIDADKSKGVVKTKSIDFVFLTTANTTSALATIIRHLGERVANKGENNDIEILVLEKRKREITRTEQGSDKRSGNVARHLTVHGERVQ